MAQVWLRKLSVGITVSAMVLSMQAASAMAAPHGHDGQETPSGAVEKGHSEDQGDSTAGKGAAHQSNDAQEQSTTTCTSAPAPSTGSTGSTTGTTDSTATSGSTTTAPADSTTTAPAPSTSCTEPEDQPQADVNLTDHGKAAEHNPNVDANGQLQPGTAADKQQSAPAPADQQQAVTSTQTTEQAKAENIAKVKEDSRAKAKAERANGEKGAYLIYVNGERMNLTPVANNGRTLVPFRRLSEFLGAEVQWDQATKTVTMTKDGHVVVFAIGSSTATVDGQSVEMPVPAELVDSSTVVPLRFIATALGADVDYDQTTGAITVITTPDAGSTTPTTGTTTPSTGDSSTGTTAPSTGTTAPAPTTDTTAPTTTSGN